VFYTAAAMQCNEQSGEGRLKEEEKRREEEDRRSNMFLFSFFSLTHHLVLLSCLAVPRHLVFAALLLCC